MPSRSARPSPQSAGQQTQATDRSYSAGGARTCHNVHWARTVEPGRLPCACRAAVAAPAATAPPGSESGATVACARELIVPPTMALAQVPWTQIQVQPLRGRPGSEPGRPERAIRPGIAGAASVPGPHCRTLLGPVRRRRRPTAAAVRGSDAVGRARRLTPGDDSGSAGAATRRRGRGRLRCSPAAAARGFGPGPEQRAWPGPAEDRADRPGPARMLLTAAVRSIAAIAAGGTERRRACVCGGGEAFFAGGAARGAGACGPRRRRACSLGLPILTSRPPAALACGPVARSALRVRVIGIQSASDIRVGLCAPCVSPPRACLRAPPSPRARAPRGTTLPAAAGAARAALRAAASASCAARGAHRTLVPRPPGPPLRTRPIVCAGSGRSLLLCGARPPPAARRSSRARPGPVADRGPTVLALRVGPGRCQ